MCAYMHTRVFLCAFAHREERQTSIQVGDTIQQYDHTCYHKLDHDFYHNFDRNAFREVEASSVGWQGPPSGPHPTVL